MGDATTLRAYLARKGWTLRETYEGHADSAWEWWALNGRAEVDIPAPGCEDRADFPLRMAQAWEHVARVEGWTLAGLAEERARREMEEPCT